MPKVVEQNTLKRRGVGMRACHPERACPGFTLFAPVFEQNRTVCFDPLFDWPGKHSIARGDTATSSTFRAS